MTVARLIIAAMAGFWLGLKAAPRALSDKHVDKMTAEIIAAFARDIEAPQVKKD